MSKNMRSFFLSQRIFNFTKTTLQLLSFVLVLMTSVNAQSNCTLFVTDVLHPTSCQATNGGMIITATDQPGNPCERLIRVTSNGIQIASGSGNMTLSTLGTGTYEVFAMNGCGCTNVQTQIITLNGGTPTNLVPQTNKGLGFVQGNKFVVCRNSDISLGVQQLGIANLTIQGPNGFFSNKPDGSSFWNLRNLQPNQSGNYIITYTNASGCISNATIALTVGALNTNVGADRNGCFGTNYTIVANTTGQATCKTSCPITLDSLLVRYTLDQCNAMGQANQDDYSEFLPTYPSLGNCTSVTATNVYRDRGDHSCTPVLGSVASDIGLCTPAQESCDPLDYDPINAVKFQITINPSEAGRLSKLTFREQSPLVWITTNGSSGVNNYNTKYLLRVYKNDFLIYSEDNRSTERIWNLESLDFSNNPDFEVTETSTFRSELRGYCVTDANGNMSAWELDDIRIYGGCCTGITTFNTVNYLWSNGATTPSINVTPTSTTDYSVKVTDCNGCKANDAMKITVFPLPTPSIDGVAEICFGKSATLSALGGIIYNWSSGQTTNDIIVSPDITTTYTVTVTNANGCTATAQKILTVNPLPTPVVTGDLVICLNESTVLTASGGDSYLWNTAATTASITVGPTTTTSYSVTVTDSKTCSANTTVEVIVNPLPIALIVGDLEICIGDETSLTATGGQNYLWSDGSTTSTISVSPNVNTTYRVTVTDGNGCSQNTSVDVVVRPLPIPTITGELTICKGNNTTLTAGGGVSYEWSNGSTSTSITVAPFVSKTFTVTVTNQFGCLAQKEALVIINPLPNPSISGNESICFGSDVTLTASGAQIFSWSNGSNSQSITVSPVESTIYIVTVTDDNGCTASTARSVTVNPLPSVAISGQGEICNGDTVLLSANVVGNTFCAVDCKDELLLNWTLDQCNANTVADKTDFTELIPNYISSGGLSEVIATEIYRSRGDHSCTPDGNGGLGLCFPAMVSCDLSEVNLQNALRFKLNLKPNEKAKLNKLTFREKSPLMWVTADGATGINNNNRFYLLNVYRNGALIFSIDQVATEIEWNLETYDFSSNPYFTIDTDTEFEFELYGYCVNDRGGNPGWEVDDIQIFGGECSSSLAQNNASYLWSNGDTTKTISVNPSATSTYSVTITDCNGCQNSTNTTIIVNDLPIAAIIGDLEICNGASTTLTASGGGSYLWSTGETTASVTVIPSATTAYNVTVTDDKGCTSSTSVSVVVNDLPIAAISGDLEICNGVSTTLTASGGGSYLWSTGETTASVTVIPSATTAYNVTVTDDKGCTSSTSATVVVNDLPIIAIIGDLEICNGASITLTASGGGSYLWSTGETTASVTVIPSATTAYNVTITDDKGCTSSTSATVVVNDLPIVTITGERSICEGECVILEATGGEQYEWSGAVSSGYSCAGSFYLGGVQNTDDQSLFTIDANGDLSQVSALSEGRINGIGYYCNGSNEAYIYGMQRLGNTQVDAIRGKLVKINPRTGVLDVMSEIPLPPNPYGLEGVTGIMTYIGDISKEGIYYFPAVSALINPLTFEVIDYTMYLGSIDLKSGNGSNATYRPISVLATCKPYLDACVEAFQAYALDPSSREPSGGIQDWAFNTDESMLMSFFGIENALFRMNLSTATTSCIAGPSSNLVYTGTVGVQTDEIGGVYRQDGKLYGHQVDRGRIFEIDETTGLLTLVKSGLPIDNRGDSATCSDCGSGTTDPLMTPMIEVCPTETTTYTVKVTDIKGCVTTASIIIEVKEKPTVTIVGNTEVCAGASTTLTASGGTNYKWSNGETTSTITVNPSINTIYNVTVSDDAYAAARVVYR